MLQEQERITDSLSTVIQFIQKERGTGELRARQENEGRTSAAIGSITFVDGRIVAARIGPRQGDEAYHILRQWGRCVFVFMPNTSPLPPPQNSPLLPPSIENSPVRREAVTGPQTPVPRLRPDTGPTQVIVPRATMSILKAVGIIERAGLPRSYRQLILLIDGRRSIHDLVTAMNCPPQQMWEMLQQLESLSIVRLSR